MRCNESTCNCPVCVHRRTRGVTIVPSAPRPAEVNARPITRETVAFVNVYATTGGRMFPSVLGGS